jgi:GNAT superfamily N-acetyltransferase
MTWQTCYRGLMPDEFLAGLSVQEREPGWRKIIDAPGSMSFVCRSQRQTVGFAACGFTRDADKDPAVVGELYAIYVLPDFWGKGYGHALWRRVGRDLILAKFKEVNLWVLHGNARGRRFYEREGFQIDSAPIKEAHVGGVKLPEVRYWKRLTR